MPHQIGDEVEVFDESQGSWLRCHIDEIHEVDAIHVVFQSGEMSWVSWDDVGSGLLREAGTTKMLPEVGGNSKKKKKKKKKTRKERSDAPVRGDDAMIPCDFKVCRNQLDGCPARFDRSPCLSSSRSHSNTISFSPLPRVPFYLSYLSLSLSLSASSSSFSALPHAPRPRPRPFRVARTGPKVRATMLLWHTTCHLFLLVGESYSLLRTRLTLRACPSRLLSLTPPPTPHHRARKSEAAPSSDPRR